MISRIFMLSGGEKNQTLFYRNADAQPRVFLRKTFLFNGRISAYVNYIRVLK
ncbi:hypothetical protein SAMN05443550_101399 [Pedobacter hartonius]|uniref:Uncharacterized protein n=1 Tax=Pedobacter hartonius TaxID=425514 RepID=A0A1H3WUD8_9SPHI|nr:hypothetical protein SAMN05443550_101399 [Pedobacter hartonius]